tara:strand:- start:104 stop:1195 length:1092 start_codon:yes stop_codon:yes gene_type:complete
MKTVYILGAGFSVSAGAPTQDKIICEAFRLYNENNTDFDEEKFLKFKGFLSDQLNIVDTGYKHVQLEDIFTPLDRCLSESSQYRGLTVDDIITVRESIFYVVGRTIHLILENTQKNKSYIDKFANYIVKLSEQRKDKKYRDCDPISVISTNWDILLDKSLYEKITRSNYQAVVDYCCYISSVGEDDDTIKPGLEMLGNGGFNVKLLKLHGSLNWLQCSRCMRLYAGFNEKLGVGITHTGSCRHCDSNFPEESGKHILSSNLIMPTFIKDLSNPQYKIIWQNAGIEISEASKLVFIGYSLPSADFEMRQLLSRMMRKNVEVEVIDFCSNPEQESSIKKHWKSFLGDRKITFNFSGAEKYMECLD